MKKIFLFLTFLAIVVFAEERPTSDNDIYYRARDVLKNSLENNDTSTARFTLNFLKENFANGATLHPIEEYLVNIKMGAYDEAIRVFAKEQKFKFYNPLGFIQPEQKEIVDGLSIYIYNHKKYYYLDKAEADSLIALVNASSISQKNKELHTLLLYCDIVVRVYESYINRKKEFFIKDTSAAENFLDLANQYLGKYPDEEETKYLRTIVIPFVQKALRRIHDLQGDPLAVKYYTGGIGIYYSRWHGFNKGSATKYIEMDMGTYMLELELQIRRGNIDIFIAQGINGEKKYISSDSNYATFQDGTDFKHGYSIGITSGYDVIDTRFLKLTPFIGIDNMKLEALDFTEKKNFILGANIDLRPIATTPKSEYDIAAALHLRLKYMAKFGNYSDTYFEPVNQDAVHYNDYSTAKEAKGNYVSHVFAIGLGVFLW